MSQEQATDPSSKVVGVGASAGGLAAIRQFLNATPSDSGLSFVIVVHLSPEHESFFSDLLQAHSTMPVIQITETIRLEPNRVYVIPPGRNLSTIDTHLRLSPLEAERKQRAPIDHFFGTLAETHTSSAVGVILSGTGSDGAAGLARIKYAGGLTIVQDPNEAEYDGMPQSAISTGMVDFILPLAEIPPHIARFIKVSPRLIIPAEDQDELSSVDRKAMHMIFAQLRTRTGQDFSRYKESTVMRRIRRRMQIRQMEELSGYLAILRESAEENQALVDDLFITVTNFFRDPEVFDKLKSAIVPSLFEGKGQGGRVRVWSVGCATGEEAYSIAMLLLEYGAEKELAPEIQVFASDLHQHSLVKARDGFYPDSIEANVSPERLARFFNKAPGGYQIRKEVRDLVIFASHNLLRDPPFSQIDLISCRNVMIYLKRAVQEDAVRLFHYALSPGRFLLLGSSETVERSELFRLIDKKHCLYAKRNIAAPEIKVPVLPFLGQRLPAGTVGSPNSGLPAVTIHQRMLERHAPPSLILNQDHNIVHFSEHAGAYLTQPGGEPTNNILRRIRIELQLELTRIIFEVRSGKRTVRSRPVRMTLAGNESAVIMRLSTAATHDLDGLLLLIFDEAIVTGSPEDSFEARVELANKEMDEELQLSRNRLQGLIEQYESGQEEMQASNEELQSTNEELRSTMEELETSKEELQSMNEELRTVNQENKQKVEELSQLSADLQNLLASTEIATLFLDRNLRILRFTPSVSKLFSIRAVDRGRPLADITHRLGYARLLEDTNEVLTSLKAMECETRSQDGGWYLTRLLPYRASDDRIDGVVLTFVDISRIKKAEQATEDTDERYRLLVENVLEYAIFIMDTEGRVTTWNAGAQRLFGYIESESHGLPFETLFTAEDRQAGIPAHELASALRDGQFIDDRSYVRRDGSTFWATGVLNVLRRPTGELRGFSKVLRDNTERIAASVEVESRNKELTLKNKELEEFAFAASHDLQEPLRMVSIYSQLLLKFVDVDKHEKAKRFSEYVGSGARRMEALINDLLGYSRVVHEDFELSQITDCGIAFQNALAVVQDRVQQTGAVISSGQLPAILGEERHIAVLFQNLLSNAMKYSREGHPPRVNVTAELEDAFWKFSVSDNGIGFAPEYAERIFGLFKRLHKDAYPGTGLGLAICRQIVGRHGGQIWAKSEGDGKGATFYFTLRAIKI